MPPRPIKALRVRGQQYRNSILTHWLNPPPPWISSLRTLYRSYQAEQCKVGIPKDRTGTAYSSHLRTTALATEIYYKRICNQLTCIVYSPPNKLVNRSTHERVLLQGPSQPAESPSNESVAILCALAAFHPISAPSHRLGQASEKQTGISSASESRSSTLTPRSLLWAGSHGKPSPVPPAALDHRRSKPALPDGSMLGRIDGQLYEPRRPTIRCRQCKWHHGRGAKDMMFVLRTFSVPGRQIERVCRIIHGGKDDEMEFPTMIARLGIKGEPDI